MRGNGYLDHGDVIAFAHRGGTGRHIENTMAAFAEAVSLGYRYLETDVHATVDGKLAAFHDPDLTRIAGLDKLISEMTLADVEALRLAGPDGRTYRIPSLDELLTTWPDARFNIDPKADEAVEPLIRAIREHGATDRVCIGSFSDQRIRTCRKALGPSLCTSMGPRSIGRLRAASVGVPSGTFVDACVQVPPTWRGRPLVDARFVAAAHARNIAVHVWTINDMAEAERLIDLGVDGIMTDATHDLRSLLIGRNQWIGWP